MNSLALDAYIVETLMRDLVGHDRQPSAFVVYLLLWSRTHGVGRPSVQIPLQEIAEAGGLSKRAVQDAVAWLVKRRLLAVHREGITAIADYTVMTPWRRPCPGSPNDEVSAKSDIP